MGRFILATNDLDASRLPANGMLENYKDQTVSVELSFRFLKDPLFFAYSLFLKKARAVGSLVDGDGVVLIDLQTG